MITGDLRNKNIQLFVAIPMYGGLLTESTFHGMLNLQKWAVANNIGLYIQTIGNESLISRARNTIVSSFLDNPILTHLLFIDADIGFDSTVIERLLRSDKDVACTIYPKKQIFWEQTRQAVLENQVFQKQIS